MSRDLVKELDAESAMLAAELTRHPLIDRLLLGAVHADEYKLFLVQTFHYVRWTSPLLARAAARLRAAGGFEQLGALLEQKANEEAGHEEWAASDLEALGVAKEDVLRAPLTPAVAAYVAWNRFHAEVGSPLAILGTAFVLEHISAMRAGDVADSLLQRSGIPHIEGALRFLRGHSAADVHHLRELSHALREVHDAEEQDSVWLSARCARLFYRRFFTGMPSPPLDLSRHTSS